MSFTQEACEMLKENISEISTVQEWAERMDYSRTHFRHKIQTEVQINPSKLLKRANRERLSELLQQNPETKAYKLAFSIGFTSIQGLYQYLKNHYNCSISQFRKKVVKESAD